MKVTINTQSLVLGECLMIVAANAPAYTRTTTAFASFHVRYPLSSVQNPYSCLAGNYGAVVNQCGYQVGLMFDLPVDGSNTYAIAVQNFALGNGFLGGPTCYAWTYDGNGNGADGTSGTFIPRAAQTLTFTTAVVSNPTKLSHCSATCRADRASVHLVFLFPVTPRSSCRNRCLPAWLLVRPMPYRSR